MVIKCKKCFYEKINNYIAMTKSRGGGVAREEFVGDYPVLGIITQYQEVFIPVRTINLCFFIMVVGMGCLWCALNC